MWVELFAFFKFPTPPSTEIPKIPSCFQRDNKNQFASEPYPYWSCVNRRRLCLNKKRAFSERNNKVIMKSDSYKDSLKFSPLQPRRGMVVNADTRNICWSVWLPKTRVVSVCPVLPPFKVSIACIMWHKTCLP